MRIWKAAVAMVCGAMGCGWTALSAKAPETVPIAPEVLMVVVIDTAQTPTPLLKKAVAIAHNVFLIAGIETVWRVCRLKGPTQSCECSSRVNSLHVTVVPTDPAMRKYSAMGRAMTVAGVPATDALAFFQPLKNFSERAEQPLSLILGCVIVHEIGHLLGLRHSPSGIMKPTFTEHDMESAVTGGLNFTPQEGYAIRASLGGASGGAEATVTPAQTGALRSDRRARSAVAPPVEGPAHAQSGPLQMPYR